MPNSESPVRIFSVVVIVSLVCSLLVAASTILLRERQQRNKLLERKRNVVIAAGIASAKMSENEIEAAFARVRPLVIDFSRMQIDNSVDATKYDMERAARDPDMSLPVDPGKDLALLHRMPRYGILYVLSGKNGVEKLILPVSGLALWSTVFGFLALESDGKTVAGITFYEHGETPGLGGEIDNAAWRRTWQGKVAYGADGKPAIEVVRGRVEPQRAGSEHQIDGISGATVTARAVGNMVNFWLSDSAYGKAIPLVLEQMRAQ